jgi:hypothetical protein
VVNVTTLMIVSARSEVTLYPLIGLLMPRGPYGP